MTPRRLSRTAWRAWLCAGGLVVAACAATASRAASPASAPVAAPATVPPVQADWAHWQRLIDTRPAEALRTLSALHLDAWPEDQRLRARLLQAWARAELGRDAAQRDELDALQAAVKQQTARPALQALWEVLAARARVEPEALPQRAEHLDRALALARQAQDAPLQSYALLTRAADALAARDYRLAAAALEAEGQVARASGDTHLQAKHLYWQGQMQIELADYGRAEASLREAAQRFRALGNPTWESDCERQLAELFIAADRPRDALAPARQAVELLQTLDDAVYLAYARSALAVGLAAQGQTLDALPLAAQAEQTLTNLNAAEALPRARLHRARVMLLAGDAAGAEMLLRTLIGAEGSDERRPARQRAVQQLLAETLSQQNRPLEAQAAWRQVIALDRAVFERILQGQLDAQRGTMEAQRLQRENDLLQLRAQAAEQALQAENRATLLAIIAAAVVLTAAVGGLWWLRRVNRRIAAVAATDALTGLPNRRRALDVAQEAHGLALAQRQPLALLMLDLDHFKTINDTLGHAAGDEVLRQIAQRLRQGLRRGDLLARWGGEEFLLLLPGARLGEALVLAERQRAGIAETGFALPGAATPLHLSLSIGVAEVLPGDADVQQTIERADQALYRAKQIGRNRVEAASAPADADETAPVPA